MREVRTIEIRAVAWRQKTADPNVEHGRHFDARHCVQYADLIGIAIVFSIEHELDVVIDGPVNVKADAVEQELVSRISAIRFGIHEAGLQSGADRNRTQSYLRA